MGTSVGRAGAALSPGVVVGIAVAAGFGAGLLAGVGTGIMQDPALTNLLRFMAVVKAAMVGGVAAGTMWRLRRPGVSGPVAAYATACAIMAAGLWPIWAGTHVAAGAALVHGGFVLAAVVGWRDRDGWRAVLATRRSMPSR